MVMRRLPSLNALRSFEAAARLGSFTDAARELYVTQGAVSRAVAGLEAWLGVVLFAREGKKVSLTPAARAYREEIAAALDRMAVATARLLEQRTGQPLRLDALPTLAMRWLIPRLPRFQVRWPGVEVHLSTSDRKVMAGEPFDVAIRRGPQKWPGLKAVRFLDERATPVCAPALVTRKKLTKPEDLCQHTLLHADPRPEEWQSWLGAQGLSKLKPLASLRFDHFYLALQAAQDGLGVAMGPLPIIDEDLAQGRLVAPFQTRVVAARSYYALTARRASTPAIEAFVEWLCEEGAA